MRSARKTIARLVSLVLPRRRRVQRSPSAHPKGEGPDPEPQSDSHIRRPLHTLGALNADVLRLIALGLQEQRDMDSLKALASCSRSLRSVMAPVLFSYAKAYASVTPSETVRYLVRHLRFAGLVSNTNDVEQFATMLKQFPNLVEVVFDYTFINPWDMLKSCLSHPSITSVVYQAAYVFAVYEPPPGDEITRTPIALSKFSYQEAVWREHLQERRGVHRPNDQFAREAKWLAAIVPNMARVVEHLDLPMETAPLLRMAELRWPALRKLFIRGRYLSQAQEESLPALLSTLPCLEELSVLIARRRSQFRPPILGHITSASRPLSGLRSLTVAYPDPADDIFSVDTTHLSHLSLRDWPRYYHDYSYDRRLTCGFAKPILTSAECLSILKRMDMPNLCSLEVVYLASTAGSDDELLDYVAHAFPRLSHLELHRYRADREETVNYVHIANLLSAARSLRTVRLNLDFHDDHGLYCSVTTVREAYWQTFKNERGPELIKVMEACPNLEYVELLYHGESASRWPRFLTSRYSEPRFADFPDAMNLRDFAPLPRRVRH